MDADVDANVFISWSGPRSRQVARALHDWLPKVIQAIRPWMSEADLEKGTRWGSEIAARLAEARIGVICLTPENIGQPWILFEAGALAKTLNQTYVCPLLFDLEPSDLGWPLAMFQATTCEKEEIRKLLHAAEEKALQANPGNAYAAGMLAASLIRSGDKGRADALIRGMGPSPAPVWGRVVYHLLCSELEQAADWYQKMIEEREPFAVIYANSPYTEELRASQRWRKLAALMNLPDVGS